LTWPCAARLLLLTVRIVQPRLGVEKCTNRSATTWRGEVYESFSHDLAWRSVRLHVLFSASFVSSSFNHLGFFLCQTLRVAPRNVTLTFLLVSQSCALELLLGWPELPYISPLLEFIEPSRAVTRNVVCYLSPRLLMDMASAKLRDILKSTFIRCPSPRSKPAAELHPHFFSRLASPAISAIWPLFLSCKLFQWEVSSELPLLHPGRAQSPLQVCVFTILCLVNDSSRLHSIILDSAVPQ
jgi:hypothetical protein